VKTDLLRLSNFPLFYIHFIFIFNGVMQRKTDFATADVKLA